MAETTRESDGEHLREGSDFYYVARFCTAHRRPAVTAWLTWFQHLDRIAQHARDPGAARLRLDWWREEIHRVLQGEARHPLGRSLSPHLDTDWQVREMSHALDAAEQRILRQGPADRDAFRVASQANWGSRFRLLGHACDRHSARIADAAGLYYATVRSLQYLERDIAQSHLPLPQSELQQHGLTLSALESRVHSDALRQIAADLLTAAQTNWHTAKTEAARHPDLDPLLRLVAQADRVARLIRRRDFQTHLATPLPTPVGLLWSAWRKR